MISNTVYSSGSNNFKNFIFSGNEWSAPRMASPVEIQKLIDSFSLCGRKLSRLRLIGHSYPHAREWVENAAYSRLRDLPDDERERQSNYRFIDPELQFPRFAQIDDPLLIEFEDDDVFEIDAVQESEFRMSMNCIPWWINTESNPPNADAQMLFSPCIDQTIKAVEVHTYKTKKDPMYFVEFDEPPYERELVSYITLRFENGIGLRIGADIDYCIVECVDYRDEIIGISFSELRRALFNWEDLHNDEITGFEAQSPTLFFGKVGAKHTDEPYVKLSPSGNHESFINISVDDLLLFDWCITHITGEYFDKYGDYRFSASDWQNILKDAQRLLSFDTFDALFDDAVSWKIFSDGSSNFMLSQLNTRGAMFWEEREKYRIQLSDVCEWTRLVLSDGDVMNIFGF